MSMTSNEKEENKFYETNRYRCLFRTTMLTKDIYHVSCGVERCRKGKRVDLKARAGYHLHAVVNGCGKITVNGKTTDVHSGQLFLLKPGEVVIYEADSENPWSYCWVTFDGTMAPEFMDLAGFTEGVNIVNSNIGTEVFLNLVQRMMDFSEMNYSCDLMRMGIMTEYIARAIESYNKEKRVKKKYREYSQENYVSYAVSLIESNYGMLQVEDIAKAIGIHRSHLASIFKKQMGVSPQEYLLGYRIKKACSLLRETQLPIQEIAAMVGYDNPLTFSKIFKKFKGLSPRDYRNAGEEELQIAEQGNQKRTEAGSTEN